MWRFLVQWRMHRPTARFRWPIYWEVPLTATRATADLEVTTSQTSIFFLPMKLRRGETFTGKWRSNSSENSGVRFTFFFFGSTNWVSVCRSALRFASYCNRYACNTAWKTLVYKVFAVRKALKLLTLKACRAVLNPSVLCSVVVP